MRKSRFAVLALAVVGWAGCATKEETSIKIYVNQKLYDKAITQGMLALTKNPNNGDTHYFLAASYYGKDQDLNTEGAAYAESSEVFLKKAFDHFMKAKQLAAASWGKDVDDNITSMYGRHYNRGVIHAKKQDWAPAALEYRLATVADPENYNGYYAHGKVLWLLASEARKNKKDAEFNEMSEAALKDLDRVLELKPTEKELQVNSFQTKGDIQFARKDAKGAQESYAQAVTLDPENYGLISTMANRFYDGQDWENAAKYFQDELSIQERLKLIEADDAEDYSMLGNALSKLNRREEAIAAYQKVLELRPNDTTTLYNIMVTYYKAGEAHEKDGKMDEAKD